MAYSELIQIRSKNELRNDFIVAGKENKVSNETIKANLIEAIRKEIFGQLCFKMKVTDMKDAPATPENAAIAESVMKNAILKWRALMKMCDEHLATYGMLNDEDLNGMFEN